MNTHLPTRPNKRKLLVFAIAAIFLTALTWYVGNYISLKELANQEGRFRAYISLNPWRSFAIGFIIYMGLGSGSGNRGKGHRLWVVVRVLASCEHCLGRSHPGCNGDFLPQSLPLQGKH